MIYEWLCEHCQRKIDVVRRIDDRNVEPSPELDGFQQGIHGPWAKVVSVPMIGRTEKRDSCYPAKVKVGSEEVVFTSKAHQDEWMSHNGYVRTADVCTDDTFNPSISTGTFDQYDPPTDADIEASKHTQWIDTTVI